MLSRVADSLYWMSRYLERAEHTARLIDVQMSRMLELSPELVSRRWSLMLNSLRAGSLIGLHADTHEIMRALTFDVQNPLSIAASVDSARANARQVRELISSEMWEQINRLYLRLHRSSMDELWNDEPAAFYHSVKDGAHLFQGITDATMSHGEGWQFIQIGRYLERASATATLLDVHFRAYTENTEQFDDLEWVSLLKCCTAFESYCKEYTAEIIPSQALEFLLLNSESPRSMRFAVEQLQESLQTVARLSGARNAVRAERIGGRLRAALDYAQIDEIIDDMHGFLEGVQHQCGQLHNIIQQVYVAYTVDTALV